MSKEMLFDIEIFRPCTSEPEGQALTVLQRFGAREAWKTRGLAGVKLTLSEAQGLARILEDSGAAVFIQPDQYREPVISMTEARALAQKKLDELTSIEGKVFGPLEDGVEQWMWWRFYVDHIPSQKEGREPGCIFIDIDKLDGHVATTEDARQYKRWQT